MKMSEMQPTHFRFGILHQQQQQQQQGRYLLAIKRKTTSTTRTEQFKGIFYSNTLNLLQKVQRFITADQKRC